mmetsp:Transcript_82371/g.137744  ORF Transcript_82371/g.137744 Transcript_82371/m.137744 type:complete len:91 (+) Transcript_82371:296-568(+)
MVPKSIVRSFLVKTGWSQAALHAAHEHCAQHDWPLGCVLGGQKHSNPIEACCHTTSGLRQPCPHQMLFAYDEAVARGPFLPLTWTLTLNL